MVFFGTKYDQMDQDSVVLLDCAFYLNPPPKK